MSSTSLHEPEPSTVTVACYLSIRLRQLGVEHLFGVPGDFNLDLLDLIATEGRQTWIGSPNELNAGYAADGYARCRGLAALVTTYGVGELSCINAIAGSYAENVPVVQITGAPASRQAKNGALLHHTLADGDFERFERAYCEVTAAGETVAAGTAAEQIDRVLTTAITLLRPVYLSIPADLAAAQIPADRLGQPLRPAPADVEQAAAFRGRARSLLAGAQDAVLVAGHLVQRLRLEAQLCALAETGRLPVATLVSAKGVIDEDHELFAGVYCGELSPSKSARHAVENSDAVMITVGTLMTDVLSGLFTHREAPEQTIALGVTRASVGDEVFEGVPMATALGILAALIAEEPLPRAERRGVRVAATSETGASLAVERPLGDTYESDGSDAAQAQTTIGDDCSYGLTQEGLWRAVEQLLPTGHRLLADIGTSFWGMAGIRFPRDTSLITQPIWNSIGYTLPATLGCEAADPQRRPILVIGDGAAQMTVQELSTLASCGSRAIVIVVDNAGYSIERALKSPSAGYNDIAGWKWGDLLAAMAPSGNTLTLRAETTDAFRRAISTAFEVSDRMVLIEAVVKPLDFPERLRIFAEAAGE